MSSHPPGDEDLTPVVGSQTDIAPLGREQPAPADERTADMATRDWSRIAQDADFKALLRSKSRFIVPATFFFTIYYFLLPILVGWFPQLMKTEVLGHANLAYVFAFSQFIMAWVLAGIYVKVAASWDRKANAILEKLT